ncbi:MAG: NUDIX hydrolase [Burkholderiales bacterium]|nr:NUDIX hydrolase [Burkholderiales bacterium]
MVAARWKPNVTVAAVAERDGRFLIVEERTPAGLMINQPAGHLEDGETLIEAVCREALEETACAFRPESLVGIYQWHDRAGGRTFLRFAFCGSASAPDPARALDHGIERAVWMTRDEIAAATPRYRSPWVLACVDDYLSGRRLGLECLRWT